MKYEFKAGDFVETIDDIGYILKANIDEDGFCNIYGYCKTGCKTGNNFECHCYDTELPNYFRRIGTYDFTEPKQPEKIEKLPYGKTEKRLCNMVKCYSNGTKEESKNTETDVFVKTDIVGVIKKLNEVIDRLNEIGEKNNEQY